MAFLYASPIRCIGNNITTDELSLTKNGVKFVPYRIFDAKTNEASTLRGILLVSVDEIAASGDPDGECVRLELT